MTPMFTVLAFATLVYFISIILHSIVKLRKLAIDKNSKFLDFCLVVALITWIISFCVVFAISMYISSQKIFLFFYEV